MNGKRERRFFELFAIHLFQSSGGVFSSLVQHESNLSARSRLLVTDDPALEDAAKGAKQPPEIIVSGRWGEIADVQVVSIRTAHEWGGRSVALGGDLAADRFFTDFGVVEFFDGDHSLLVGLERDESFAKSLVCLINHDPGGLYDTKLLEERAELILSEGLRDALDENCPSFIADALIGGRGTV